jgi:hypothetical protein
MRVRIANSHRVADDLLLQQLRVAEFAPLAHTHPERVSVFASRTMRAPYH